MKVRILRKMFSGLLCLSMVLSVVACGSEGEEKTSETSKESSKVEESEKQEESTDAGFDEVVTLTAYAENGFNNWEDFPWYQSFLEENFGFNVESYTLGNDASVINTLMAGGELCDITEMQTPSIVQTAVENGMFINLDDYKDQLPAIYENDKWSVQLDYLRETYGGVYFLSQGSLENSASGGELSIRWDLYKKLGYPEINDFYDLLDVLKQMQELEPETSTGLPTYGLYIQNFTSWKAGGVANSYYATLQGYSHNIDYMTHNPTSFDGELSPILEDDSINYKGLKFLFTANQMGLLHPEGIAMDWATVEAGGKAGQYFCLPHTWWNDALPEYNAEEDWRGFAAVAPEFWKGYVDLNSPYGMGWYIGIGSKCEYIDRALAWLNWYFSEEGNEIIHNGPQGILWDRDENGNVYLTDTYYEYYESGETPVHPDGGELKLSVIAGNAGLNAAGINSEGLLRQYDLNPSLQVRHAANALEKDYMEHNDGYKNPYAKAVATGDFSSFVTRTSITKYVPPIPAEFDALQQEIGALCTPAFWNMIFAEDEAEFEAIWDQVQKDADALGYQEIIENSKARYEEAKKIAAEKGVK